MKIPARSAGGAGRETRGGGRASDPGRAPLQAVWRARAEVGTVLGRAGKTSPGAPEPPPAGDLFTAGARAELAVSAPGDASERAADRIGAAALGGARPANVPLRNAPAAPLPPALGVRSEGEPLPPLVKDRFAPAFGAGWLARVVVHRDAEAAASARALGAAAYSYGRHIVMGADAWRPASASGRALLAHELGHVATGEPGRIGRQTIGERNAELGRSVGCDVAHPDRCPTYEGWLSAFRDLPLFVSHNTAPAPDATQQCYQTLPSIAAQEAGVPDGAPVCVPVSHPQAARRREQQRQRAAARHGQSPPPVVRHDVGFHVLGDAPAALQSAPRLDTGDTDAVARRFIDRPTQDWIDRNLPAELAVTAYRLPTDCADIAVVLRHVWLFAHRRSEAYGGFVVGWLPRERDRHRWSRVGLALSGLNTPNVASMLNAYSDSRGNPVRSFARLEPLLHPGDVLVWAHHHGGPGGRRSGGHTQTIMDIVRDPSGHIVYIIVMQGNQPIFAAQAADIEDYLGPSGRSSALREAPGRRIEVNVLLNAAPPAAGQPPQQVLRRLQDVVAHGERVWGWEEGTTLVAAGPPAGGTRRGARPSRTRTPEAWIARLGAATAGELPGVWESTLASFRAALEGGGTISTADASRIGRAAAARARQLLARDPDPGRMAATMATTMATMLAAGEMVRDTTSPSAVNADAAYQALLDPLRQIARADAPAQAAPPQPLSGSPSDPGVMIPPWPTPGAAPPAAGRAGSPNGGTWQQAGVVHFGRPPHFPAAHVLGETAMPDVPGSDRYVYPELRIDTSRAADGSGRATVRPTQARDAVHPSFAFGPGGYRVGPQEVQIGDRARTETFTAALIVDSTISERARAAEQEHLDDMVVAYQLSLERAAAAVNAAAGQPFSGPTEADAEAAARTTVASQLPPRLGVTPAAWRDANLALARLSRRRDEQQTHSFIAPLESYDLRARVVLFRAMEGPHTRLIGTLRPEQLVRLEALPPASTGSPAAGAHSRLSGPSADRDPLRPRCSACAGGAGPCASCDR